MQSTIKNKNKLFYNFHLIGFHYQKKLNKQKIATFVQINIINYSK